MEDLTGEVILCIGGVADGRRIENPAKDRVLVRGGGDFIALAKYSGERTELKTDWYKRHTIYTADGDHFIEVLAPESFTQREVLEKMLSSFRPVKS